MKVFTILIVFVIGQVASAKWEPLFKGLPKYSFSRASSRGDTILASYAEGLIYSVDNGENWKTVSDTLAEVPAIFMGEGFSLIASKDTLYKAVDMGGFLEFIPLPVSKPSCVASDGSKIVIGSSLNGIYISTDKGSTWTQKTYPPEFDYIQKIAVKGNDIFIVARGYGVYRSTNNGDKWKIIDSNYSEITTFALYDSSLFYAYLGGGLYKTDDWGKSWNSAGLLTNAVRGIAFQGSHLIAGTDNGLFETMDGGSSWKRLTMADNTERIFDLHQDGSKIVVSSDKGLYCSDDFGKTWRYCTQSYTYIAFNALKIVGNRIFAGNGTGLYYSTDRGASWEYLKAFGNTSVDDICFNDGVLYTIGTLSSIYYSGNYGESWICLYVTTNLYNSFFVGDSGIYCGSNDYPGYLFKSKDSDLWRYFYKNCNWNVYQFVEEGPMLYEATSDGIKLTTDNGVSWKAMGFSGKKINYVSIIGDRIYTCSEDGVYYTEDGGDNWNAFNDGLPENCSPKSIKGHGDYLCVALNNGGIYTRRIYEYKWMKYSDGLDNIHINSMDIDSEFAYICVRNRGIYRSRFVDFPLSASEPRNGDAEHILFPAPALDFINLPEEVFGEISVFSVLGGKVFSGFPEGDRLLVSFLPPGIYFVELKGERYKFIKI